MMAMQFIKGGAQAFGQEMSDRQQIEQLRTNRNMAVYNSQVSRIQAEDARRASRFEAKRQIDRSNEIQGMLDARLGASGGATDVGVALDLIGKQAAVLDLDRAMILYEGEQEAGRFESQARLDDMDAAAYAKAADEIYKTRYIRSFTAFLGGGGAEGIGMAASGNRNRIEPKQRVVSSNTQ